MNRLLMISTAFLLLGSATVTANQEAIEAMVKEAQKEQASIQARVAEIDEKLDPILESIAKEKFFLEPAEFQFLRKQKESPKAAADFFKKQERVFEESIQDIDDYLDIAYDQIRRGNLMFGKESELIKQDAKLFSFMESKIHEEIAVREDGKELMDLIEERERLRKKRVELGPVADYLTERREWWKNHPDYFEHVQSAP